ncbi:ABC transporter permease [Oceanobacillus piezotolerans]|uniref:ABC transporter permease n=1 Tax=Oceanobacillus piezotolerans TaxID=2448030 RepID=UPI0016575546|nr:ABC transporter permease [Oceanobacillus piezotolerans]
MVRLLRTELLKLRKSSIWLLIFVSPFLSLLVGLGETTAGLPEEEYWLTTYQWMSFPHAALFLPLLTGVFSAFVCRYEHVGGGWKQLAALPVSRGKLYLAKLLVVCLLIFYTQILLVAGLFSVGQWKEFQVAFPWETVAIGAFSGWLACLPLIALQMLVSVSWSSFAAPMAVNVIFTLPNILILNSETYGPYYPWAQPFLAMMPHTETESFRALHISMETLFIVILGSLMLFLFAGFTYFIRKEI